MEKDRRRSLIKNRHRNKTATNKSIDKLTYCPKKHKQKFVRKLRQQLQATTVAANVKSKEPVKVLKFRSWNLDGIEAGTIETLENMIEQEDLDVRVRLACLLNIHLNE